MLKQFVVLSMLAAPLTVGAQTPTAVSPGDSLRAISLDEAVALAQRNNPAAVQARGQLRSASSAVRSAYGAFLPSVNLNMSQSKQTGRVLNTQGELVSTPTRYSSGISSSIDLFDGFRRFNDLRARRADVDAAEANEITTRYSVALQVKQQYAAILAARESEAAARAQIEQAEAQMRDAVARVQAGAATMSDSLRSLIQVGNARLALMTAQNNLRVGSAALTRLVGTSYMVTADPLDTLDAVVRPDVDSMALIQMALEGPAVREAELALIAARASERSARGSYLPSVSMSYRYTGSGTIPYRLSSTDRYEYGGNIGFQLSFPIFNNFSREDQVVRARIAEDNAAAQLRDARLAAQQSLVQQLGSLRTAEERIRIQQASVLAAEEDLRVIQQRYALGASTLLELLTSQSQLNQARAALIQARQDYRIARAQIEALIGRDLQ